MEETVNKISEYLATYGLNILAAVLIFLIGKWIVGKCANGVEGLMKKRNVDATLATFAKNLLGAIGLTFVFLAALSKLGVQTASFIAVLGAAGLAIGLALQGSLANFAAGVLIVFFKPYKSGDFIKAGGVAGTVKEVQIFNTVLSSPDNVRIIIPNAQVTSGSINNYSANDTRRVDLVASIAYGDDIKKAKEVLSSILAEESRVLKDPAPVVAVSELADSSVNLVVRPWVKSTDYWPVFFALTEKIKLGLEKGGLSIPFPQQDIHINTLPAEYSGFKKEVGAAT